MPSLTVVAELARGVWHVPCVDPGGLGVIFLSCPHRVYFCRISLPTLSLLPFLVTHICYLFSHFTPLHRCSQSPNVETFASNRGTAVIKTDPWIQEKSAPLYRPRGHISFYGSLIREMLLWRHGIGQSQLSGDLKVLSGAFTSKRLDFRQCGSCSHLLG